MTIKPEEKDQMLEEMISALELSENCIKSDFILFQNNEMPRSVERTSIALTRIRQVSNQYRMMKSLYRIEDKSAITPPSKALGDYK